MDQAKRQVYYARLMQYWQDTLKDWRLRNNRPLSFEVPKEYDSAKLAFWLGNGLVKDDRLYLFNEMRGGCCWSLIFMPSLLLALGALAVYFTSGGTGSWHGIKMERLSEMKGSMNGQ